MTENLIYHVNNTTETFIENYKGNIYNINKAIKKFAKVILLNCLQKDELLPLT